MNPALSPRSTACLICKEVADLADVALRLWDEDGERLSLGPQRVAKYLAAIGVPGSPRALQARAVRHRDHCERYMGGERKLVAADDLVVKIAQPMGPARWLDVQQDAMNLGRDALAALAERLRTGGMEDKDIVALAKLGAATAGKRADLEAKGRKLNQMDELLQLAAGLYGQERLSNGG